MNSGQLKRLESLHSSASESYVIHEMKKNAEVSFVCALCGRRPGRVKDDGGVGVGVVVLVLC